MKNGSLRQKVWLVLRLLGTTVLLALLIRRVDGSAVVALLPQLQSRYLFWAASGFLLALLLVNHRWYVLCQQASLKNVSWQMLLRIRWKAFFWTQFLPSTVGGDGYRILALRLRYPQRLGAVTSTVILDRMFGYLALLLWHHVLFLILWTVQWPLAPLWRGVSWLLVGGSFVFFSGIFLAGKINGFQRFPRIWAWMEETKRIGRKAFVMSLGISFVFVPLSALVMWWSMRAFDVFPPFLYFLYAYVMALLLSLAPVTINGMGLLEGVMVLLLEGIAVPVEVTLAGLLLWRMIQWGGGLIGGLLYLWEQGRLLWPVRPV